MSQSERLLLGQFIPLHYHFQMLSNGERMQAFRQAIELVVQPGMRVADLGSGTGVLSFFAARCGARVWAVEMLPELAETSRRLLSANGVADRVTVSEGDAAGWLPPEPVDVVMCEMLHSALLREKQLEVCNAFRRAHLARFGRAPRMLPEATLLAAQPVFQVYDFEGYHAPVPLFQSPYHAASDCRELKQPLLYATIDYAGETDPAIDASLNWSFAEACVINALRFITKSLLAIDTSGSGASIEWHNHYLVVPLERELELAAGQGLAVRFSYQAGAALSSISSSLHVTVEG